MVENRIICTACGAKLDLPVDQPVDVIRCSSCGKRLVVGRHPVGDEDRDHSITAVLAPAPRPLVAPSEMAAVAPTPASQPSKRSPLLISFAGLLIGVILGIAGAALMLHGRLTAGTIPLHSARVDHSVGSTVEAPRGTTDSSVQAPSDPAAASAVPIDRSSPSAALLRLEQMKRIGDDSVAAGDLHDAIQEYERVLAEAGRADARADPSIEQIITETRAARETLLAKEGVDPSKNKLADQPALRRVVAAAAPRSRPTVEEARKIADTASTLPGDHPRPTLRTYLPPGQVTDKQIGQAIDKAILYLRTGPVSGTALTTDSPLMPNIQRVPGYPEIPDLAAGETMLVTYALLNAGRAMDRPGLGVNSPAVVAALEKIKSYSLGYTYFRSLRAAALAVYNRPEDYAVLEADVKWLIEANHKGGYTYTKIDYSKTEVARNRGVAAGLLPPGIEDDISDNSNSQYGLLGVWSGALCEIPVPPDYWHAVEAHWIGWATPDGRWGYKRANAPYLSMTLAGVASLLVCQEYLEQSGHAVQRPAALIAGLAWLNQGDNCLDGRGEGFPLAFDAYTHYGLERVGLATGYKRFGTHDWYAEVAAELVGSQSPDGCWVHYPLLSTAYNLLFLARGRAPLMFNKLHYDGDWDNRPYDATHLARFATAQLERPLNWQVVDAGRPWQDWSDAPVLYISGDKEPKLNDADYEAIRDFALAGGMVVTHADNGSAAFTRWVQQQLVRRSFPNYELTTIPATHPLYTSMYHLSPHKQQPLLGVDNGCRLLLVHCPADIAGDWRADWKPATSKTLTGDPSFQMGLNLFVYAAGKANYRNRLAPTYVPQWQGRPSITVPVARLKYAGEWDPEPYAWTRFARAFSWETHAGLDVRTIDLKDLKPGKVPAAFLTGTVRQDFTAAEAAAVHDYVSAGGVLVIDACGGNPAFDRSVRSSLLKAAFPDSDPVPLAADHPALIASRAGAQDVTKMPLRPFAAEREVANNIPEGGKSAASSVEGIKCGGGWVLIARHDLTVGLLGTQTWGVDGYDPAYAEALLQNVILWSTARSGNPVTGANGRNPGAAQ